MEFSPTAYLGSFTVETPDTVWIKKRPKKNPELGKHYVLNKAYKGVVVDDKFVTPATAINGKPFAVYSVTTQSSYSLNCTIRLLDLENLDIVNFVLYENFPEDFKFTSAKTQRLIKLLEGQNVYYCPDMSSYSSSSRTFTECTYLNGDFYFEVTKSSGMYSHYTFKPYAQIRIKDLDGNVHSFSPIKKSGYSSTKPVIISQNEYETNYKVQYIETDVDTSILQEDIDFPFSFVCIFAQPSHYASVYQKIDPSLTTQNSSAHLDSSNIIGIGDKVNIGGTDYFKACYNGKTFFIKTLDVKLIPSSEAELDSLMCCSPELRDKFYRQLHALDFKLHLSKLEDGLEKIESYAKYGLAITKWGVYDVSEYTDGTGIQFTFLNPTKKVIKYITITFLGYNAVDDPVGRSITKKCIGPIEPDETASYDFEYAWYTDIVEYAKIRSILVQYQDGTTKSISNPKSIIFDSDLQELLYGTDPVQNLD